MKSCSCHSKFRKYLFLGILIGTTAWMLISTLEQLNLRQTIVGQAATPFSLQTISGQRVDYQPAPAAGKIASSKRTILLFWATWCPECKDFLSRFKDQYDDLVHRGINVHIINAGEPKKLLEQYFQKTAVPFPILLDEKSKVAKTYHIWGVPSFVFINEDGIISAVTHGLPKGRQVDILFQSPQQ